MSAVTRQSVMLRKTRAVFCAGGLLLGSGLGWGAAAAVSQEPPATLTDEAAATDARPAIPESMQHLFQPVTVPDRIDPLPDALEGVDVIEYLGQSVPRALRFTDSTGKSVQLGDYLDQGRPVVLQLAYYRCPVLCTLVTSGLAKSVQDIGWLPGEEFQIVTVSIDPTDTPLSATRKKTEALRDLGERAGAGWHFLVGGSESIDRLAQTVGFGFRHMEADNEYSHAAVLMVLTPDGRISRYLYGIEYPGRDLRLSLVEAADGQVGSTIDRVMLFCLTFDPLRGKYTATAFTIMRAGGVLTVVLMGGILGYLFLVREYRQRRSASAKAMD